MQQTEVREGTEVKHRELIIKSYPLRHNSFSAKVKQIVSKQLRVSDREVECVFYFGGGAEPCVSPESPVSPQRALTPCVAHARIRHSARVRSSRLLPAGSVTIGIIKNWLPQTVPWLTCIIEPESVGNLPRVKEAERNTLWLWTSFSETSHTQILTFASRCHSYT